MYISILEEGLLWKEAKVSRRVVPVLGSPLGSAKPANFRHEAMGCDGGLAHTTLWRLPSMSG